MTFSAFCRQSLSWMSLGCELELLNLQNQQLLPEAFRTVLLQRPQLQIVVRPWWMDIPSGSSRMTARRAAPRLFAPAQPEGNCSRQSISCCTFTSACRSDNWHSTCRSCGLAGVSATANCQTPALGHKSGRRDFLDCSVLREIVVPESDAVLARLQSAAP